MSIASRQRSAERANGRIMAEQTIIESVRAFLQGCPLLTGDRINVDFLAPEEGGYSINASPAKPIIQQYVNGSSKRQFVFVLASSEYYGEDIRQQLDNIGFYQQFAEWIETAALPTLSGGKQSIKVETLSSGYVFLAEANAARYQIECRLIYFQEEG